jgi:hypothetical protein
MKIGQDQPWTTKVAATDLASQLDALRGRTTLTDEDALAVRRVVFGGDWRISRDEAEALISLNEQTEAASPAWNLMFVDTITEYVVRQPDPPGYVEEPTAAWLVDRLGGDGRVWRSSELEAVTHILEQAAQAPASLARFALDQARTMLAQPGRPLSAQDVALLRRIVFAPAGLGSLAVTRPEAEVLFDINDAVRGQPNDPSWTDFFARAIGNAVLAATPHPVQSRADALRQQRFLEGSGGGPGVDGDTSPLDVLADLFSGRLFRKARENTSVQRLQMERYVESEEARLNSEAVMGDEAQWVTARLGRDGVFDENEAAAIRFIEAHAVTLEGTLPHSVEDLSTTDRA